jgi:hypothetical protein
MRNLNDDCVCNDKGSQRHRQGNFVLFELKNLKKFEKYRIVYSVNADLNVSFFSMVIFPYFTQDVSHVCCFGMVAISQYKQLL